ncbi:EpsG family protein [uncultured Alistipes sp.]|nr:EpsG family protein [uncultured Alistipes sp.]
MFGFIAKHYTESNWSDATLLLYFIIVTVACICSRMSQRGKVVVFTTTYHVYRPKNRVNYIVIAISFLILVFFSAFRDVGVDVPMYKSIFLDSTSRYADTYGIEPGFLILNKVLRIFGVSADFAIAFFSVATLWFIFKSILHYADQLNIGISVLAVCCLYYFPSFNMMRMYFAASIMLYGFRWLLEDNLRKYLCYFFIASLIHYSAVIFLPVAMGILMFQYSEKIFFLLFSLGGILSFKVVSYLSSISIIARYDHYLADGVADGGLGIMHWVINIPLFALYLYASKKLNKSVYLSALLVLTLFELLIGLLSYQIVIFGRSLVYFNVLFVIIIPILLKRLSKMRVSYHKMISSCYVLYLLFRFYIYLSEYLYLDGIMPYKLNFV